MDRKQTELAAFVALVGACVLSTACSGALAKGDGRAIGDDLGRFRIDAKLTASNCGTGADGQSPDIRFDVFLSELPPHVYWNSGPDSVEGNLASDGVHFTFESETVVAIPGDESAANTCTIVRTDHSSGAFDDAAHVQELEGLLEYDYTPQGQSDCSTAMATQGFAALPCKMKYSMAGTWFSAR
jgi:hypothetical protein